MPLGFFKRKSKETPDNADKGDVEKGGAKEEYVAPGDPSMAAAAAEETPQEPKPGADVEESAGAEVTGGAPRVESPVVVEHEDAVAGTNVDDVSEVKNDAVAGTTNVDMSEVEDGYINADVTENVNQQDKTQYEEQFDGVRGTIQAPGFKDTKHTVLFALHLVVIAYLFVESFLPGGYGELLLSGFVVATSLVGIFLTLAVFSYLMRHDQSAIKSIVVFSNVCCAALCVLGLFLSEGFMAICGFTSLVVLTMYASTVWKRVPFTEIILSSAIAAVRENSGLVLAAGAVSVVGIAVMVIGTIAGANGSSVHGWFATLYSFWSYYWVSQVLCNIVAVTTSGIIGRWLLIGEITSTMTGGLRETLDKASTYSSGSVCYGSLHFGFLQMLQGLSNFIRKRRKIHEAIPNAIDRLVSFILRSTGEINEYAFVYVGMYGYPYTEASQNVSTLLRNKGWDGVVRDKLAGNILMMANVTIGMITGFAGLTYSAFQYKAIWRSGFSTPSSDGFFVGFLVGFMMSSIFMSIFTSTVTTLVVCLAESPQEIKTNHPHMSTKMEAAWKDGAERDVDGHVLA